MRVTTIALLGAFTAACGGSTPPPNTEFDQAQADIARAEGGGAVSVPNAKLHLQLAAEDLQKSRSLAGQDNKRADSLLALSRTEATLALSLARAAQAQAGADQAQADLQKAKSGGTP